MGTDNDVKSVVDPQLRVKGIKGLRIIDASVIPSIPSGDISAAVLMIAEKGSQMIIEDFEMENSLFQSSPTDPFASSSQVWFDSSVPVPLSIPISNAPLHQSSISQTQSQSHVIPCNQIAKMINDFNPFNFNMKSTIKKNHNYFEMIKRYLTWMSLQKNNPCTKTT